MSKIIRRLIRSGSGVTLVEMLVVVGIMTMASGLVGSGVFQVLAVERYWREDVVATKELRHAGSYFAGDALNTEATNLIDGGAAANSVTLQWADAAGAAHTAIYSLSGDQLVRDLDGAQLVVARRVVTVGFSLNLNTITFDLEVQADAGNTESMSLSTYLRLMA